MKLAHTPASQSSVTSVANVQIVGVAAAALAAGAAFDILEQPQNTGMRMP